LQRTFVSQVTIQAIPRYGRRGRPQPTAPPQRVDSSSDGALASAVAARPQLVRQQSGCILATKALDHHTLSPQEVLGGSQGQPPAERGWRFLKAPHCLASALSRKKPERIMALLMVMTVGVLVYAALESRIRKALKAHDATWPNQEGQPVQHPTARWVFHAFVGMHVLLISGQWDPLVLHLTEEHQSLLRLLGKPYERFYR
jgi:transposase